MDQQEYAPRERTLSVTSVTGRSDGSAPDATIAYGVMAIIVLVAPLLVVAPVLLKIKRKALLEYGALVTIHDQQFDEKWIQKQQRPDEEILGNPDASSLVDLGNSFTVVR